MRGGWGTIGDEERCPSFFRNREAAAFADVFVVSPLREGVIMVVLVPERTVVNGKPIHTSVLVVQGIEAK